MSQSSTKREFLRTSSCLIGTTFFGPAACKVGELSETQALSKVQFIHDEKCLVVDGWVFPVTNIRPRTNSVYAV